MNLRHADGLTLVELLIGLVLGQLLIAVMIGSYLGVKRAYLIQDGLSRAQENARAALRQLSYDLRMAGHRGTVAQAWTIRESAALPLGSLTNACHAGWSRLPAAPVPGDIAPIVGGADGAPGVFGGCIAASDHLPDSDILSLHYLAANPTADNQIQQGKVYLRAHAPGGMLFLADLDRAIPADMTPAGPALNHRVINTVYYLRRWSVDAPDTLHPDGDGIPTLMRATLADCGSTACIRHEPIVEGIAQLQFRYGLAGADGDLNAAQLGDVSTPAGRAGWRRVRSVRIAMLARDARLAAGDTLTPADYPFGEQSIDYDAGYRQLWLTDRVALRNPVD